MNEMRDERYDELCKRLSKEKVFYILRQAQDRFLPEGEKQAQGQGKEITLKSACHICGMDITRMAKA